jgi:hypothetical protein
MDGLRTTIQHLWSLLCWNVDNHSSNSSFSSSCCASFSTMLLLVLVTNRANSSHHHRRLRRINTLLPLVLLVEVGQWVVTGVPSSCSRMVRVIVYDINNMLLLVLLTG